jgi:hypothetical protein
MWPGGGRRPDILVWVALRVDMMARDRVLVPCNYL